MRVGNIGYFSQVLHFPSFIRSHYHITCVLAFNCATARCVVDSSIASV